MFKTLGAHVKPPADMPSPLLWGDEATVKKRFGAAAKEIDFKPHFISFDFPFGVPETIEFWREFYGPTHKAFASLDENGQANLRRDPEKLWAENNLSANGSTHVVSEYLEVKVYGNE